MADFNMQFVESIIPGSAATVNVDSPPLLGIQNFNNAFFVPMAFPQMTAGIGRATGGAENDTLLNVMTTVQLTDIDSAHFDDGTSASSNDNLVGAMAMEYVGAVGGPNEVKVRAVKVLNATGTTVDSDAIVGISDINKVVPFAFMRGTINNGDWANASATVEVVVSGSDKVVRLNRPLGTNAISAVVYVVEFIGSNWSVKKVPHTMALAATNEDEAIAAVTLAKSFVYTTASLDGSQPNSVTHYVWLANTTTLRHRMNSLTGGGTSFISYVISNAQLSVAVYGADPDGTADLNATGTAPETRNITITAVPDKARTLVLGFAGSDHAAVANRPSVCTMFDLTTTTNLRLRRSISVGNTEYKIQVIDFSALQGSFVEDFTPLIDGALFTINGLFGASPTVTVNGVAQTVQSSDSISITCTAVLGNSRYGVEYDLIVTDGGQVITAPNAVFSPNNTKGYVDLAPPLATASGRLITNPELTGTEQIEWSSVIGGVAADVIVYSDAAFSIAESVTQFSFRTFDPVTNTWGTLAVQDVTIPAPPKTKALSCPLPTI